METWTYIAITQRRTLKWSDVTPHLCLGTPTQWKVSGGGGERRSNL